MKKILILTAGFGDGHNAAARSLRDAIELLDEDARAEVLDFFADSYGAFNTFARKTYLGMVQYAPRLWGGIYSLLENPIRRKAARRFHPPARHAGKNPGRNPAGLRRLHLSRLRPRHQEDLPPPPRAAVPVHHRRHGFHHHQFRVVPRAERSISAWPTRPPPKSCARAASPEKQIKVARLSRSTPCLPRTRGGIASAGRRRTAPRALHHQHRQEKGRQGH